MSDIFLKLGASSKLGTSLVLRLPVYEPVFSYPSVKEVCLGCHETGVQRLDIPWKWSSFSMVSFKST